MFYQKNSKNQKIPSYPTCFRISRSGTVLIFDNGNLEIYLIVIHLAIRLQINQFYSSNYQIDWH